MFSNIALRTERLSKCYRLYDQPQDRLKQFIVPRFQGILGRTPAQYFREFWALRDVSLTIGKGETVGIIGRNGSGKSTLLQMFCGTLTPTSGMIEVQGRIAAILELGAGFHPEFTGRENVYLNGSLLGLTRAEIDERFEEITGFADIGEHLDQPVKTYSSGMYVRLAFAVAAHVDAEILVVDEALAVGDIKFQQQCMRHLAKCREARKTFILVSHDLGIIKALCQRVFCMHEGSVVDSGDAGQVVDRYVLRSTRSSVVGMNGSARSTLRLTAIDDDPTAFSLPAMPFERHGNQPFERSGSGCARVSSTQLLDSRGRQLSIAQFGETAQLVVVLNAKVACPRMTVAFYVKDRARLEVIGTNNDYENMPVFNVEGGEVYTYKFQFALRLKQGCYSITVILANGPQATEYYDWIEDAVSFEVLPAGQPIYALYAPSVEVEVVGPLPRIVR